MNIFTQKKSIKAIQEILNKAALQDYQTAIATKRLLQIAMPSVFTSHASTSASGGGGGRVADPHGHHSSHSGQYDKQPSNLSLSAFSDDTVEVGFVQSEQAELVQTGLTCLQNEHNNAILSFNVAYLVVLVDAYRRTQISGRTTATTSSSVGAQGPSTREPGPGQPLRSSRLGSLAEAAAL